MIKKYGIYLFILVVCLAIGLKTAFDTPIGKNTLTIELKSSQTGETELFYDTGAGFNAVQRITGQVSEQDARIDLIFELPYEPIRQLRWDPVYHEDGVETTVYSVKIAYYGTLSITDLAFETVVPQNQIKRFEISKDSFHFGVESGLSDPYLIFTRIPEIPEEPSNLWVIIRGAGFSLLAALILSAIYRGIAWYFDS
jgi:hypothetical protein